MTTATKSKGKKTEAETVTRDGILTRNQFVVVVAVATGCDTMEATAKAMGRTGVRFTSIMGTTSSAITDLKRKGLITVVKPKPGALIELSLTDAGWDALAKTRAFYATERF